MYTISLKMRPKSGCYEKYKRAHDQLWPELAEGMRQCQVSMSIGWDGETLFVFAAAPTEDHWLRSRQDPVLEKWNTYMTEFLETDQAGGIAFQQLEKAFGFGDFE